MKRLYTIGEMAKLHGIAESKLRYYDEIDLFKPAHIDEQTRYRYYSLDQFILLELIKFWRQTGVSLKEMKRYLQGRTIDSSIALMEQQYEESKRELARIAYQTKQLEERIALLKSGLHIDETIRFVQHEPRPIVLVRGHIAGEAFSLSVRELETKLPPSEQGVFFGAVGAMISQEAVQERDFGTYIGVFYMLHHSNDSEQYLPAGLYATMDHYGEYEALPHTYERLLHELEQRGYRLIGHPIEIGVLDYAVVEDEKKFVTRIEMLVDLQVT